VASLVLPGDEPPPRQSRVKPVANPPENVLPIVERNRFYVWNYLFDAEKGRWKKPALSPKPGGRYGKTFEWRGKKWEKQKDSSFGNFEEAYRAYEDLEGMQGIGVIVEPYLTYRIGGRDAYLWILEMDDCYDPDAQRVTLPEVGELLEGWRTYAEVSPSGTGIHAIGLGERHPKSYGPLKGRGLLPEGIDVNLYGGGVGGRQGVTFTGVPVPGYDLPPADCQGWLERRVPLKKRGGRQSGAGDGPESDQKSPDEKIAEAREAALLRVAEKEGVGVEEVRRKAARAAGASDEEILATLRRVHRKDGEFERLWEGRWREARLKDKSHSAGDLKLTLMLASATGLDADRVSRLFEGSGLHREERWGEERYRKETIKSAFEECDRIYEHRHAMAATPRKKKEPESEEDRERRRKRDAVLKDLEELRLNLAWGYRNSDCPGGMAACFFYEYLIRTAHEQGWFFEDWGLLGDEDAPGNGPRLPESRGVLVRATDIGAMKYSAVSNGDFAPAKTLLTNEPRIKGHPKRGEPLAKSRFELEAKGLVTVVKRGAWSEPTLYLLNSPRTIPDSIFPSPPDLLLDGGGIRNLEKKRGKGFAEIYREACSELGLKPGSQSLRDFVWATFGKGKGQNSKGPFRSPLNSYAAHDIKHLRDVRLPESHPDATPASRTKRRKGGGWEKDGEGEVAWVTYGKPHPPMAFSPPYSEPLFALEATRLNPPLSPQARYELANMKAEGLKTQRQKFLLEQIGHRHSIEELTRFFHQGDRKDNIRRDLKPFVEMGLAEKFEGSVFGRDYGGDEECYRRVEGFEEALHETFLSSPETHEAMEKRRARAEGRRGVYRRDFEERPPDPKEVLDGIRKGRGRKERGGEG